jgi:FixJ family two-component response regulator
VADIAVQRGSSPVSETAETIIVIDDDPGVRESLDSLLRAVGFRVRLCASVSDYLASERAEGPACLVLDVRLPGQGGLEFQRALASAGDRIPVVFITGHGDIKMSVRAMKDGALEFLTKPFSDQDLLEAIHSGLERDRVYRAERAASASLRACFKSLTPREREVMAHVAVGRLNKQIASDMGVSEIMVKVHRGAVMRKMNAKSLAELVLMARELRELAPAL